MKLLDVLQMENIEGGSRGCLAGAAVSSVFMVGATVGLLDGGPITSAAAGLFLAGKIGSVAAIGAG